MIRSEFMLSENGFSENIQCLQASFSGNPIINSQVYNAAMQEPECSCVSRVLVLYTGGTIGMKCVAGSYSSVSNYFLASLTKMPTFCDPKFEHSLIQPLSTPSIPNKLNLELRDESLNSVTKFTNEVSNIHEDLHHNNNACEELNHIRIFGLPLTKHGRRILYSVVEYWPLLDSSDLGMNEWTRIAKDIYKYYTHFDGFVILHGTDTLAYTASALSFMFENLGKPIVLTGAQIPVFEFRSDGWNNFLGALLIAGGGYSIPEVTVFFHDKLFRGSRIVKSSSNEFDAFHSPNYPALAEFGIEVNIHEELIFRQISNTKQFQIHTDFCRDVAVLNLFPLIASEHISAILAPPTKGVVIRTYGAGNVPSSREDLLKALKSASDRGVLMVNVTQCWHGGVKAIYSTGMILNQYGVTPGYDMTTEAALLKLSYVLSKWEHASQDVKRAMLLRSLRGEVTVEGEDARAAQVSDLGLDRYTQEKNIMIYFAKLFNKAKTDDPTGLGVMWLRRITPIIACCAAASNNICCLKELNYVIGHLQLADTEGCSPLHKSAFYGQYDATKFLLECGVSVHLMDKYGLTPLNHALEGPYPRKDVIDILLATGATLNMVGNKITHKIHEIIAQGDVERLKLYLLCGYNFQNLDQEGRSSIHVAVAYRQLEVLRFLVSPKSIRINYSNEDIKIPKSRLFLPTGAGVNLNCLTSWNTTALDEAKMRNYVEIVQFIEESSTELKNYNNLNKKLSSKSNEEEQQLNGCKFY